MKIICGEAHCALSLFALWYGHKGEISKYNIVRFNFYSWDSDFQYIYLLKFSILCFISTQTHPTQQTNKQKMTVTTQNQDNLL